MYEFSIYNSLPKVHPIEDVLYFFHVFAIMAIAGKTCTKSLPTTEDNEGLIRNDKMPLQNFESGMGACCSLGGREIDTHDAYIIHPTIVDASFHLGTTFERGGHKALSHHSTMVPASLSAYTHVSIMPNVRLEEVWTTVGNMIKQTHDAAISSYNIRRCNNIAEASVTDLLAKSMRGPYQSIDTKHEQLRYTLQWKAVDASTSQSRDKDQSLSHHMAWRKVSGVGHLLWQAKSKSKVSSLQSTAMSLQVLQTILGEEGPENDHYQVLSTLDRSALLGSYEGLYKAMATEASLGLVRTAAQERPGLIWQALSKSPLASSVKATSPSNDIFGSHQSESIIFRQQVLSAKEDGVLCGPELLDSMLVTGGTGELGILLCLQAASYQARYVVLTSRSGRVAHKSVAQIAAMKHTIIARGDIGCTDEARCCFMPHNDALPKVVMHAGTCTSLLGLRCAKHASPPFIIMC